MRKFFMLALLACCWLGTTSSARPATCNIDASIGATHELPFQGCVFQSPAYNVEVGDIVLGMTKAPILWTDLDVFVVVGDFRCRYRSSTPSIDCTADAEKSAPPTR